MCSCSGFCRAGQAEELGVGKGQFVQQAQRPCTRLAGDFRTHRPDTPGPHDSSLVGRLSKTDNCRFQKQNKQTEAFVSLSCGGTWIGNEAKIIAYFALRWKAAFCPRSCARESRIGFSLQEICGLFSRVLIAHPSQGACHLRVLSAHRVPYIT